MYDLETALEVLNDFRLFMQWNYFSLQGKLQLEKETVLFQDRTVYLTVNDYNQLEVHDKDSDAFGLYSFSVASINEGPKTGNALIELDYVANLLNKDTLNPEDLTFFKDFSIFACSFFQRCISGEFIAAMQPKTVEVYAETLVKAQENQ